MKIGMLGTGQVGQALGSALVERGHEVMMGSRSAGGERARAWVEAAGEGASEGTFAQAAAAGEWVFNCTAGAHSLVALEQVGAGPLAGKILVDVSNPLDFSEGFPPSLTVPSDDSLGEQIQRAYPEAKVVKTLNTVGNAVMVDPGRVPGAHTLFVCGEDAEAKARVTELLREEFGWEQILDLGGIERARGTEHFLALWVRLYATLGTDAFNIELRVAEQE